MIWTYSSWPFRNSLYLSKQRYIITILKTCNLIIFTNNPMRIFKKNVFFLLFWCTEPEVYQYDTITIVLFWTVSLKNPYWFHLIKINFRIKVISFSTAAFTLNEKDKKSVIFKYPFITILCSVKKFFLDCYLESKLLIIVNLSY